MKLNVLTISSNNLEPNDSGFPEINDDFDILVEVLLYEENRETNSMYFEFTVTSPKALSRRAINTFLPPTLVLDEFSWSEIKKHVEKLLMYTLSCESWECVVFHLGGLMRPVSPSSYNWSF